MRYIQNHQNICERIKLNFKYINIDNKFLHNYLDPSFPYIKASDLIYLLIAKKHKLPLITEDKDQYKVAVQQGIEVYTIKEFIERYI